jgi:Skp family chaperone for outer membrane proteins
MKGSALAASIALAAITLGAAPVFAQQPPAAAPAQTPPAQTPPKPAVPAQPAAPAPAPRPPEPFPVGAKVAFINPQAILQQSVDGKAAIARINALIQKKQKEGEDKAKLLQGNQQKLQTSGSVMNEAARSQPEKEIDRQQKEIERFQQDAQAEINDLQQEVQNDFLKKVNPVLEQVAIEKGVQIVLNAEAQIFAWASMGLDLSPDIVKKLDAASKPAATPKE